MKELIQRLRRLHKLAQADYSDTYAAAEAAEELERREWQPIETCPKDGSEFLAWVQAEYSSRDDEGNHHRTEISFIDIISWRWDPVTGPYHGLQFSPIRDPAPTHWMPLPEPPEEG